MTGRGHWAVVSTLLLLMSVACSSDDRRGGNPAVEAEVELDGPPLMTPSGLPEDLSGANLSGQEFIRADLRDRDLSGATLEGAVFAESDLSGANLTDVYAVLARFVASDLEGASLAGANLREAVFEGSLLLGTDLTGADLTRANMSYADLNGAILDGATLEQTQMVMTTGVTNEMLAAALGVDQSDLVGAIIRADLELEFTEHWVLKVRKACRGKPIEGSAPYSEGPGFHPAAMEKTDGDEYYSQLPSDPFGLVPDLRFLEIVACFGSKVRAVEGCGQYSGGVLSTPVYYSTGRTITTVRLFEAATGDLIAEERFSGPPSDKKCPKYVTGGGVGAGPPVRYKDMAPFIERYTNRP